MFSDMKDWQINPMPVDDIDAAVARLRRIQEQIDLRDLQRLDSLFSEILSVILGLFTATTGLGWSIFVWVLPHP